MIIQYDTRPDANIDEKLKSLIESIQLALNEVGAGTGSGSYRSDEIVQIIGMIQRVSEESSSALDAIEKLDSRVSAIEESPVVDADTTYSLSKSGNTITLTGSDGVSTSVSDDDTLYPTLVITTSSFSSLPQIITDSNITENHVVVNSVLSNPSAQMGDWTVTTEMGELTISGTINGTTEMTLYLNKNS